MEKLKLIQQLSTIFELAGVIIILLLAFMFQIVLHEIPCPLCLLQRVGFVCIVMGFLMNLRFGFKPSHYSVVLISALYTSFVSLRQVALHVIPGTGGYGDVIFGLHLYTWSFLVSMAIIVVTTILMGFEYQYQNHHHVGVRWRYLTNVLFLMTMIIIISNIVSVLLECGLSFCPDNPVTYELLNKIEKI